jgi:hypothetical protein
MIDGTHRATGRPDFDNTLGIKILRERLRDHKVEHVVGDKGAEATKHATSGLRKISPARFTQQPMLLLLVMLPQQQ